MLTKRNDSYTIAWKQNLPDVDLDGVEYKSLPSGLHDVKNDLVYFIHGQGYAGISAFAQEDADSSQRNANFCSVGALVPISHGKLGASWKHAPKLRHLAKQLVKRENDARILEQFWETHSQQRAPGATSSKPSSPVASRREKKISESQHGSEQITGGASDHPALYIPALLDSFGPLIFPLCRAALLRERILLLGSPPVQRNCSVVYILSILSSIPQTTAEVLHADIEPILRAHPIFSVGISDIPMLSETENAPGWIATTTDDILGEKHQLWDILVELAPEEEGSKRRWPQIRSSDGRIIKATQRDLRRYRLLRGELERLRLAREHYRDSTNRAEDDSDGNDDEDGDDENVPLVPTTPSNILKEAPEAETLRGGETEVVEPVSWTAMAYNSFMWWASAGEEDAFEKEDNDADRQLLSDLPDVRSIMGPIARSENDSTETREKLTDAEEVATVLTAYFHRITGLAIQTLADIVTEADDETEEETEKDDLVVTMDHVRNMGLDIWSLQDRQFVEGAMRLYFGRDVKVEGAEWRVCGVKVC